MKWLIEDQLAGELDLNFDPERGPVVAPWLSWGAYLWADGLGPDGSIGGTPGRSDGLEYECADFQSDGTHPSESGREKVANLLADFLSLDPTIRVWFKAILADDFESGDTEAWSEVVGTSSRTRTGHRLERNGAVRFP